MSDETKATPRPWRYEGDDEMGDFVIYSDKDFIGNVGARMEQIPPPTIVIDVDRANAELIVKAVNAYDLNQEKIKALVAACEAAEAYTRTKIPHTDLWYPQSRGSKARSEWIKLRRKLVPALALARKEAE